MTQHNTTATDGTTERRITLCGTEFIIRQPSAGTTTEKWDAKRYKHTVTIKANGTSKRFSFYGSVAEYEKGQDRISEDDLIYVLDCIISDAIYGSYSCEEFFDELGYENSCEGIKAYRGCKDTFRRLDDMGIVEEDLYNMSNELREMEVI